MDAKSVKPLLMRLAARQDAPRIAEIHMAAVGSNAMLRAQFPTAAIRQALQISIENKAIADIDDPKTTVLVVTVGSDDPEKSLDTVISFAKWSHPVDLGESYVEPPWTPWQLGPPRLPRLRVVPSGVLPATASPLSAPNPPMVAAELDPICYKSTEEAAAFYEKNGLIAGEVISLPIRIDGNSETQIYKEVVFSYHPVQ